MSCSNIKRWLPALLMILFKTFQLFNNLVMFAFKTSCMFSLFISYILATQNWSNPSLILLNIDIHKRYNKRTLNRQGHRTREGKVTVTNSFQRLEVPFYYSFFFFFFFYGIPFYYSTNMLVLLVIHIRVENACIDRDKGMTSADHITLS